MKTLAWLIVIALLPVAVGIAQNASDRTGRITGSYQIYTPEKQIQTDEYEVVVGVKAVDKLKMTGSKDEQKIEIGTNQKNPAANYYEKFLNGASEQRAAIEKDYIWFYERDAKVGALTIDPYLTFFDPTAYAGYTVIMKAYDVAKGGNQSFSVIVPGLQDYCVVEVERHGSDAMTVNGKVFTALHYHFILGKREAVNIWVDQERIIAMQLTVKGLYVVDASYPDLLKEVKRVVTKSS